MRIGSILSALLVVACGGQEANRDNGSGGGAGMAVADGGGSGGAGRGGQGGTGMGCGGSDQVLRECLCAMQGLEGQARECCVEPLLPWCKDAGPDGPDVQTEDRSDGANPCSGKACGESCHSWRINAEACDIHGECSEARYAFCTCNPCDLGCQQSGLCDAGRD